MKYALIFLASLFLTIPCAFGETRYVTDVFEVMVRTGPNKKHKIIAMPQSGTPVEVIELPDIQRVDEWVKVRLGNDKEGWMLSQYLIAGPPKATVIDRLERDNSVLKKRSIDLSEENARLKKENRELGRALTDQTTKGNSLKNALDTLESESKDFLTLKGSHERVTQELKTKTTEAEELQKEVEGLRNSQTLRWFVAGASIILVGFIIGYASRRPKRRSSLL
jgi:SH3 domain protein